MENKGDFLQTCHIFDSLELCLFCGRDAGDSTATKQSSRFVQEATAEVFQFLKLGFPICKLLKKKPTRDWFTCSLPCSQPSASSLHCKPGPQQLAGTPGFQFSNTTSAKLLISKCPEKENWVLEGFGICPDWAEHLASDEGVCYEVKSLQYKTLRKLSFVH